MRRALLVQPVQRALLQVQAGTHTGPAPAATRTTTHATARMTDVSEAANFSREVASGLFAATLICTQKSEYSYQQQEPTHESVQLATVPVLNPKDDELIR